MQHASKPLDKVASTAAATLAAAGVVAWSRQTGLWRMALMAGAWAMVIVPQYAVHNGDALLMDMARLGAVIVALLLATTAIDDDNDDKHERYELKDMVGENKPANSRSTTRLARSRVIIVVPGITLPGTTPVQILVTFITE